MFPSSFHSLFLKATNFFKIFFIDLSPLILFHKTTEFGEPRIELKFQSFTKGSSRPPQSAQMASPPHIPPLQKPPRLREPAVTVKPLKKPVLPPSLRPKRARRCCRYCCCIFCVLFLVLFFFLVVAGGLIYVIYDPRSPIFHLQSFRIRQLNVTNKPDGPYLDAQTTAWVEVRNPNSRMRWHFVETIIQIWADDEDVNLGSVSIPAFTIRELEVRSLKAETSVTAQPMDDSNGKNLKIKVKNKEIAPTVDVRTRVGVTLERWKVGTLGINVVCGKVSVKKLESGESQDCTINVFKWVKI